MQKLFIIISAFSGIISVGLGAFGAHAFQSVLEQNQRLETFETAVKYHFFHTLALLAMAILMDKLPVKFLVIGSWGFVAGIILFSGSLYILSISGNTKWGAVTPIGGLAFMIGWAMLLVAAIKS